MLGGLAARELRRRCDPAKLGFATTAELEDFAGPLGQARADEAIRFAIAMPRDGYNIFAMGPEGLGRHTLVRRLLESGTLAGKEERDWCYVFNFETPHRPCALQLPAGRAAGFRQDMARLVEDLRAGIPAAFETDEYRARAQEIEAEFNERQEHAVGAVGEHARAQGIALLRTPGGFGFAPMRKDSVMTPQEFHKLPQAERERFEALISALQEELASVLKDVPKWRREALHKLRELNREVTRNAVAGQTEELKSKYASLPQVRDYLSAVQEDVLDNAETFRQPKEGEQPMLFGLPLPTPEPGESPLRRYKVNVLIERGGPNDAPIVYEDNPTHDNLLGRIEHVARMGALVTDFTLIKPGALHRANGGALILDALKLLTTPFAWDALKRALRSRVIRIESLGQALSLVSTVSLEPEPIPLELKVVLVGQRLIYYLLHQFDPEFGELFKVAADFEEDMPRGDEDEGLYARVIAGLARREKLRAFDSAAVASIIERGAREAGDAHKLSVQMRRLVDLLRESDHYAGAGGAEVVAAQHVRQAIEAEERRFDRVRKRLQEGIQRETLLIDSAGERVGQVNGLSVVQLGGFAFGLPHRITARARLGGGKVVDIERESELGGPIHSKGVLILSGFLAGRYAPRNLLSLSASLVFEQSYGMVEGDSASSAELYALLSALSGLPIRQSLAVTGSVNQHGDVQAIGGVNEKIEGFFDVCRTRGLNGSQGVLIPASNVKHLMLREDVVSAVEEGRFHVYPVGTVDQGIERLTGVPAGERGADGRFPAGSVNFAVEQCLADYAERLRMVSVPAAFKGRSKSRWRAQDRS